MDSSLVRVRRYQAKHRALGLCLYCNNPKADGILICSKCQKRKSIQYQTYRANHYNEINERSRKYYREHREEINIYHRKHYQENRDAKLKREYQRREEHRNLGLCYQCSNPRQEGSILCSWCIWTKKLRRKRYYENNKDIINERQNKRKQQLRNEDRCVLCGTPSHGFVYCATCQEAKNSRR